MCLFNCLAALYVFVNGKDHQQENGQNGRYRWSKQGGKEYEQRCNDA
jgi:hypothetical protein